MSQAETSDVSAIDELMEKASAALLSTDYFECQRICLKALDRARHRHDFERMSRICLPLQESRRQIRQMALDAGLRAVLKQLPTAGSRLEPGCYLLEPPRIGIEARIIRELGDRQRTPVMVMAREPLTKSGKWPIVGVGEGQPFAISIRVQVAPPDLNPLPSVEWFLSTHEKLGDAAIAKVDPRWPADHRVDDFLEMLPAVPEHEKLMQALAAACREAAVTGVSEQVRRRPLKDNPYSF
jgi:hypothetical protein